MLNILKTLISFLAPCQDNRLRGQEGGETSFLVPWQLQTFCPHPEWQQWEAASSEEAGIHHNSHIYPLGNGYWVVWEDMPKKKHFSFVHWKKGQWAWFLVIIIIIKIIIIIAIKGQIGKTIWLPIPYRKASHFFRSFLLPPPSFHLGTTAQRKNVVRRSFWEEWLANDTLRIFSFNHRSIRSFVILHWGCLGTTNLSF